MVLRKTLLSCAGIALLAGVGLSNANADTYFGSVTGGVFKFDGTNFTSGTSGFASPVSTTFNFLVDATVIFKTAGITVDAKLTLSGVADGSAAQLNGAVFQKLKDVTETITENGTSLNLVSTINPVNATLSGSGQSLNFSIAGNNLFNSDYFNLTGRQIQTITFNTDSVLGVTGTHPIAGFPNYTLGTLNSFSATATSNLFSSSSVPEASTLIGLGGLVLGGGLLGLRRRKA